MVNIVKKIGNSKVYRTKSIEYFKFSHFHSSQNHTCQTMPPSSAEEDIIYYKNGYRHNIGKSFMSRHFLYMMLRTYAKSIYFLGSVHTRHTRHTFSLNVLLVSLYIFRSAEYFLYIVLRICYVQQS
jgi:hypothetical protein